MRLTLITPSLNAAPGLGLTLKSGLDPDGPDREHWVIDGGSTDETLPLLRRCPETVRWVSEPDRGIGDAVNKGFERATGDVIGWINVHDAYAPGALAAVTRVFEAHPEVDFLYGDSRIVDDAGRALKLRTRKWLYGRQFIRQGAGHLFQPTVFFNRRLLQRVGGCDASLRHGVDYDLWCRMVQVAHPYYLPEVLSVCRALPNRRYRAKREYFCNEIHQIRKRYTKGFADRSWCWLYDLRLNLLFMAEPVLARRFPDRFQSALF
jgi:glycosyltransferase involved in cell wall biosynthesis